MNRRPPRAKVQVADFSGTMKRLFRYLGKNWIILLIAALFAIVSGIISTIVPIFVGNALSSLYNLYKGGNGVINIIPEYLNFEVYLGLWQTLNLIVIFAFLSSLLGYLQGYMLIGITQRLTYKMRSDLADKLNTLPLSFFDKFSYGDILSRMTNDVDIINQTLSSNIIEIFRAFTLIVAIVTFMFVLRWEMAIIAVVMVVLSFLVAARFVKISQKFFMQQAKNSGDMNGHVEEHYNGHLIVKVFGYEEKALTNFNEINERIYDTSWKAQFVSGIMMPVQFFFSNMAYIIVAIVGGYLVMDGKILPGLILTFVQFMRQVSNPIQTIGQTASVLQMTAASAERVFFILDAESEEDESHKPQMLNGIKGHVVFKDVYFSYDKETPVIQGFNAEIKPGQTVAIVGPTGAGKTTIVNLLMRFYEIDRGEILIDGVNIKDMKRDEVRSYFGMVLQDTWIFEGTVYDNIAYGKENATKEEVIEAAKRSQSHHFIQSLPDAYNFMLSEDGLNISAGQRQLLTISRAMLANKPMLILDEATSNVDTRTEILIQQAMDNLMKNRTAFVIAHRLSTIKNADVIFVMRDGNIIEQGNHQSLIEQNGFYAQLYNSQFEK